MKFYQGSYFPPNFKYLGYIGVISGTVLTLVGNVVVGIPVFLVSLVVSTTLMGCQVDILQKTITNFTSVVGLAIGTPRNYKLLQKIILREEVISQVLNSRGSTTTIQQTMYNGYLLFDSQSIYLTGSKHQNKMIEKMEAVSKEFSIPLEMDLK